MDRWQDWWRVRLNLEKNTILHKYNAFSFTYWGNSWFVVWNTSSQITWKPFSYLILNCEPTVQIGTHALRATVIDRLFLSPQGNSLCQFLPGAWIWDFLLRRGERDGEIISGIHPAPVLLLSFPFTMVVAAMSLEGRKNVTAPRPVL